MESGAEGLLQTLSPQPHLGPGVGFGGWPFSKATTAGSAFGAGQSGAWRLRAQAGSCAWQRAELAGLYEDCGGEFLLRSSS